MLIRFSKESQRPAEWALGLRLSSPREQERHNVTVITVGSKYYSLCSISSSLSHANPEQPFCTLKNKVRGKYICKEVFLRLSACVCLYHCVLIIVSLWYCRWVYKESRDEGKMRKEYLRRKWKLLEIKLSSRNIFKERNIRIVPLVR